MVPTPRALALESGLHEALGLFRRVLHPPDGFDPATSRRTFTVALEEQPAAALAPALAAAVLAAAPAVRLAFVRPERDSAAQLESGAADIVIGPAEQASGALMMRSVLENDFLTAQRKGHPRGRGPLDLDGFCALDHLVVSTEGGGFSGVVNRTLAGLGRTRRVALSIHSYGLAPLIVAGTDGLCTLPGRLLRRFAAEVDLFPPPLVLRASLCGGGLSDRAGCCRGAPSGDTGPAPGGRRGDRRTAPHGLRQVRLSCEHTAHGASCRSRCRRRGWSAASG